MVYAHLEYIATKEIIVNTWPSYLIPYPSLALPDKIRKQNSQIANTNKQPNRVLKKIVSSQSAVFENDMRVTIQKADFGRCLYVIIVEQLLLAEVKPEIIRLQCLRLRMSPLIA